ncbi:hypothetical protein ACXHPV_18030, partial [Vibrio cincinnatiensis]
ERTYETSNIMRIFPKKENTPAHKKLKPMHPEHKALFNLITTNFKLTKESIMAILFTKEEAMKDLPFIEDKA